MPERQLASDWVNIGFLAATGEGKQRKYQLDERFEKIFTKLLLY